MGGPNFYCAHWLPNAAAKITARFTEVREVTKSYQSNMKNSFSGDSPAFLGECEFAWLPGAVGQFCAHGRPEEKTRKLYQCIKCGNGAIALLSAPLRVRNQCCALGGHRASGKLGREKLFSKNKTDYITKDYPCQAYSFITIGILAFAAAGPLFSAARRNFH